MGWVGNRVDGREGGIFEGQCNVGVTFNVCFFGLLNSHSAFFFPRTFY